ncbi:ribonuclease P protein component [Thioalkalivibrio sp.]|uniref:ribonuclease P protein component n=1 Tax=Thioalkalivibrio sp. TaxID=2093813 RepID=UPI00356969A1
MTAAGRAPEHAFPRSERLLTGRQYQRVFSRARRVPGARFMLLYRPQDPPTGPARLGLAISRKHARRAVERNRLKRIAREAFRARRQVLPPVDIIVLSRAGAAGAGRAELRAELDRLLEKLK